MVTSAVLLDTNIIIDYLNGIPQAHQLIHERDVDRAISLITWVEVMAGTDNDDEATVKTFLARFRLLPVDTAVATTAVLVRKSKKLKLPDAIILATAMEHNRVLITRDTKDFPPDLIHCPYKL